MPFRAGLIRRIVRDPVRDQNALDQLYPFLLDEIYEPCSKQWCGSMSVIKDRRVPRQVRLPDFIQLALHTGCRKGELLRLEWRKINLQAGLIYLEAEHTNANRRRSVPPNGIARAAIMNRIKFRAKHCPASHWVFCNKKGKRILDIKRSFPNACKRAGIEDFRIHDLRHTCAAWLVTAGVPLAEVRDLLGHHSVKMTERYAHLAPENVRAAVERIGGSWSRSGHVEENKQMEIVS
jgi:integrase